MTGFTRESELLPMCPLFPIMTGYYANIYRKHEIDNYKHLSNVLKLLLGSICINLKLISAKKRKCVFDLGDFIWLEIRKV